MALIEKFTQVANSFISLVRTRASIHLDNLSQEGLSKITTHAGGIPKTAVSNVITSSKDVDYTLIENSEGETLALQGEYIAYCPNGKWADGSMKSNEIEVALDGSHAVDISTATGTNAIMVSLEGVMSIHPYVVSFTTPKDAITNRIWYDLTHNQLKIYDGDWDVWHGFKVGTLIKNVGQDTKVILHNTVQLMDCATILDQIELAKVPVGTVIAYMGTDVPEGYLLMDGRLLSRTTYSRLFSVIGTTQGEGDGSTTFQIANMTDGRYLMGSTVAGGRILVKNFSNGTSWYKWYSDGWLEQGGIFTVTATSDHTEWLNLPKPYNDNNFVLTTQGCTSSTDYNPGFIIVTVVGSKSNNSKLYVKWYTSSYSTTLTDTFRWSTSGYSDVPTQADWLENLGHTPLNYYIKF